MLVFRQLSMPWVEYSKQLQYSKKAVRLYPQME